MNDFTRYERNLPHRLTLGEQLFITTRLAGSLPATAMEKLQQEKAQAELEALRQGYVGDHAYTRQKRYFGRFDAMLDEPDTGPIWLRDAAIAQIVADSLHFFDGKAYQLICYTIMPNHLHVVLQGLEDKKGIMRTLQRFKSYTALLANRHLSRTGQFWQRESYDHLVRDSAELERVVAYVLNNPVKAGLVDEWQHWPFTYLQS